VTAGSTDDDRDRDVPTDRVLVDTERLVGIISSLRLHCTMQVCVQPYTAAVNMTLLTFAANRHGAVTAGASHVIINRYLLPARPTAANLPLAAAAVDSWARQMDGHRTVI